MKKFPFFLNEIRNSTDKWEIFDSINIFFFEFNVKKIAHIFGMV